MRKGYIILVIFIIGMSLNPIQSFASSIDATETIIQAAPDTMEVHFIDVGQGASTLIMCGGQSMLIDAGDNSKGTLIQDYLEKQGIEKLDYLVLTHSHPDHIGGAPEIITKYDIDKVFFSNCEEDTEIYQMLLQAFDDKDLEYETPEVGAQYALGSATITILAPNDEYDKLNDSSIAFIIQNGNNRFLFTGDAGEAAEKDILNNDIDISADVYHVGHHGANDASSREFVKTVSPGYAVISCGEDNIFGVPHEEVLNTLKIYGVKVHRTDEEGTIIAVSDGKDITFTMCEDAK